MIIKKNKNIEQNNLEAQTIQEVPSSNFAEFNDFSILAEREERRRGDRRRGYRRADDRNVISRAQEEANSIKELASKEGFRYGLEQAKEELNNLKQTVIDLLNAKELAMKMAMPEIAEVAVKTAAKILKIEIACDDNLVLNIIEDTLKEMRKENTSSVTISINPADKEIVESNILNIFPFNPEEVKIKIEVDENVDWGSCIIETSNGIIDSNFSTQLEIVRKAFEL
jgi:flagellar assembly protein FliH